MSSVEETREVMLAVIREKATSEVNFQNIERLARAFALVASDAPPVSAYEDHDVTVV